ncbi:MAG: hypothetical protein J5497_07755, partial [Selenomonadaceae bacterium]|nr:hypothetical protein [Selenomonadaceae bacterium]
IDMDKMREDYRENAKKSVLADIMLDQVADAEKLTVSEQEINYEIAMMAQMYRTPPKQIAKYLQENGQLINVVENIRRRKATKFILDNSAIASKAEEVAPEKVAEPETAPAEEVKEPVAKKGAAPAEEVKKPAAKKKAAPAEQVKEPAAEKEAAPAKKIKEPAVKKEAAPAEQVKEPAAEKETAPAKKIKEPAVKKEAAPAKKIKEPAVKKEAAPAE